MYVADRLTMADLTFQVPDGPAFVQTAIWGLKPFWLNAKRPPPINARAESVTSSAMFREARRTGRRTPGRLSSRYGPGACAGRTRKSCPASV